MTSASMGRMAIEIARLCLGLLMVAFHQRIADFVLEGERSLVIACRSRGLPLPAALRTETAHNLYLGIGMFIVLVEWLRLYQIGR
ncbi:MAG: hypothetical protein ABSD63_07035 [Candidatus Korobacteraceae bacterium]